MTTKGRKNKQKKIGASQVGVIDFPTRSIYLDAVLRFELKSTSDFEQKQKFIREAINEFYLDYPGASLYSTPIIHFNSLTAQAIKTTRVNTVVVNIMFFLRKPISSYEEIRVDLFQNLLEEIQI